MTDIHIGLIEGRHAMTRNDGTKIDGFFFDSTDRLAVDDEAFISMRRKASDYLSKLTQADEDLALKKIFLYATGFTPALTAVVSAFDGLLWPSHTKLYVMHWDNVSKEYVPMLTLRGRCQPCC